DRFPEIAFHDTGPGISPASIPRLFDPFYTEKKHGVGMGLAVCLRIVTAHDGSIQAVPHADGGATIIVRLPKRPD
ncbi:MAG TPA: ATP-binding protein, partial [Candidatus Hydrogenedentes bacterium]|nr:ATP-binding protein [Candidatus Hydrogenedentota bacterium]